MMYFTNPDWDGIGRLIMAVGVLAMLAYLAPSSMALSPPWRRSLRMAASGLLALALLAAIAASILWFLR